LQDEAFKYYKLIAHIRLRFLDLLDEFGESLLLQPRNDFFLCNEVGKPPSCICSFKKEVYKAYEFGIFLYVVCCAIEDLISHFPDCPQ